MKRPTNTIRKHYDLFSVKFKSEVINKSWYDIASFKSGALTDTWTHHANMDEVVKMTYDMGKAMGCDVTTSSALVRCLRAKPVEDFIAIYEGVRSSFT